MIASQTEVIIFISELAIFMLYVRIIGIVIFCLFYAIETGTNVYQ